VGVASGGAVRVLAFVEARGITGAIRNLLDFTALAAVERPPIQFELATYRRPSVPGRTDSLSRDIDTFIAAAHRSGIHTHVLEERRPGDPALFGQLRALVDRTCPDVVETHHVKSHFLAAASGVASRHPWIAFHHGYTATSARTRMYNLLDHWSLRQSTAVVTPCGAFAAELSRRGVQPGRITVIHNGVAPAAVRWSAGVSGVSPAAPCRHLRRALGIAASDRIVLAAGRLSREKGHAHLVRAFATAPLATHAEAVLVIAGEGPERPALMHLAASLGISARVHLVGYQVDMQPYYAAADVVALPSDSEGSPNALLEAMAAGKPVVATRVGGVPEIAEHGHTALLVPRRDPSALAAGLASVLCDPAQAAALGAAGRHTVIRRFSIQIRAAALSAVYRRLHTR
jgi:glycosyltransferase involved in cell wall biosynthesis